MQQFAYEPDLLYDFIVESQELLDEYAANLLELENQPDNAELVSAVFRAVHTLKGSSAFFNLDLIKDFAHNLESLLDGVRHGHTGITEETIGCLLLGGKYLKNMFDQIGQGDFRTELTADESRFLAELFNHLEPPRPSACSQEEALSEILALAAAHREGRRTADQTLSAMERILATAAPRTNGPDLETPQAQPIAKTGEDTAAGSTRVRREETTEPKTMRISEEKVDGFMNCVGELMVTAETFTYLQKTIEQEQLAPRVVRAFHDANQAFRKLSGDLQECLMEIRRVPIKGLMQRVNLMARDLAQRLGKKVRVEISGQEVQLDKSIAERLEGPLMHVVRNSLDHGIEPPEVREKSAKPSTGLLQVAASTDQEFFYLEIRDDGQGIDPRAIRAGALNKGLITPEQARTISDREATDLIFAPGFSTADRISDVSGRGVGMDVVRTNISRLNGAITLDSTPGLGTTIRFKIPLKVTLQVIQAILVGVGGQTFFIPVANILESLRPRPEDLIRAPKTGEMVNIRGRILPLIRLNEIFNLPPNRLDPSQAILVLVESPQGPYALMVDDIFDMRKVVVKELTGGLRKLGFLSGCATLGDGRLALVLDTGGMVSLAQALNGNHRKMAVQ